MSGENVQTKVEGSQASITIQSKESGGEAPKVEQQKAGDRPAWLPEKFKSPEDLAKSYTELEKKFTQTNQDKTKETPKAGDPAAKPLELKQTEDVEAQIKKANLDMGALEQEFADNGGKLTEESLQKLKDNGIDQGKIDAYVRGRQAQAEDYSKSILTNIEGGLDGFKPIMEWAEKNLKPNEIAAFNKSVSAGDADAARLAVDGLASRYTREQGPQLITGDGPSTSTGDVYQSRAQISAAQRDPQYKTDPAFRKQVEQKILRTDYSKLQR